MLVDKNVTDLMAAFSSPDPTPGGGSAAALASAVGASLLMMVSSLPKTRSNRDEERAALATARRDLEGIRNTLIAAVDADTSAYDQVVAAYRLPKASPDEQQARKNAIQHALHAATEVPLSVLRLSAKALEISAVVAENGLKSASSDVGVARALLAAGATGARLNVEINLDGLADEAYRTAARLEVSRLSPPNPSGSEP